jgi:hypothetical protein
MKFVEPSTFKDPDAAARKLVEIANASLGHCCMTNPMA